MAKEKNDWVKMKPEEVTKKIVELGKQGLQPEKIGLVLRDEYGIPKAKLFGKKIGQVLRENKIEVKSEEKNLTKKLDNLKKHFEQNKHDYPAKNSIIKTFSRLNKFKKISAK
jgi:small subunit ribosomal protein S15